MAEDNSSIVSRLEDVILELRVSNLSLDTLDTRVIDSTITINDQLSSGFSNVVASINALQGSFGRGISLFGKKSPADKNAIGTTKIITEKISQSFDSIKEIKTSITQSFDTVSSSITKTFTEISDSIKAPFVSLKKTISAPFIAVKEKITGTIDSIKGAFSNVGAIFGKIGGAVKGVFGKLFGKKDKGDQQLELLKEVSEIKETLLLIKGSFDELLDQMKGDSLQAEEDRLDSVRAAKVGLSPDLVKDDSPPSERKGGFLEKIGKGIGALGKGIGDLFQGIFVGIGKGLKAISNPRYFIGVAVIGALSGALMISAKAFKKFGGDIDWKNVLYGVGVLGLLAAGLALVGKLAPKILLGSLALIAISGAMFIAGKAFQQFTNINWKGVLIGTVALGVLAAAAFGLSLIAPAIFIGALAIAALGAALIPAAKAFEIFSRAAGPLADAFGVMAGALGTFIEKVGQTLVNIMTGVADTIERFSNMNGENLKSVAVGIGAIGAALVAFGGGTGLGAILGFLAEDPVEKFERFAAIARPLKAAADSIRELNAAIKEFAADDLVAPAAALRIFGSALASLYSVTAEKSSGGIVGGIKKLWNGGGGGDKLKGIKDLAEVSKNLNSAITFQLGDPATVKIEPSTGASGAPAAAINNGSIERETLVRNQQAAAISAPIIANSSASGAPVTQNNNNVTYNKSNHIDSTMLQSVLGNAF